MATNGTFTDFFADGSLQAYIRANTRDPWKGTPFVGYVYMSPKQQGEFGERFVTKLLEMQGRVVEAAHSSTAGYDRYVNGKKTEIKYSLATRVNIKQMKICELVAALEGRGVEVPSARSKANLTQALELALNNGAEPLGVKKDSFVINHVSKGKDWEYFLFVGINKECQDLRIAYFTKLDFINHMETSGNNCLFNHQQGGTNVNNDDYMCTKIPELMSQEWVHTNLDDLNI